MSLKGNGFRKSLLVLWLGLFPSLAQSQITGQTSPASAMSDVTASALPTSPAAFRPTSHASASSAGNANRLDFISVAVICGVVALCFIICVIVGCRRRKRRHRLPRCEDVTPTALSPSVTDTDGPTLRITAGERMNSVENSSSGGLRRHTESPPPTYSVIERQTSFSSYVSQTSSMIEVPPDYEDAWNPDVSTETDISQLSHNGSSRRRRTARSASSRGAGPPPARSAYRSQSDADGRRRTRPRQSSRPSPVAEDDVLTDADTTARSIDVIIEVNSSPRTSTIMEQPNAEASEINDSAHPLIANLGREKPNISEV